MIAVLSAREGEGSPMHWFGRTRLALVVAVASMGLLLARSDAVVALSASPSPGTYNVLSDVAAVSATDAWAVGSTIDTGVGPSRTLVLHWDGSRWSQIESPNPGISSGLSGVTAVSATDVWAVGQYDSEAGLLLHWDGTSWSQFDAPAPPTSLGTSLSGVAATSSSDVWAVGTYMGEPVPYNHSAFVLHWDGNQWSQADTSSAPSSTGLADVSADSGTDAWAVGTVHTFTTRKSTR